MWSDKAGREEDMSALLEQMYSELRPLVRPVVRKKIPIPDVDPNKPGLDDLFAWGEAVAEAGGITVEKCKDLLALIRQRYDEDSD